MSATRAVQAGRPRVKPVRRSRGSQLLTFVFTFFHPVIFGLACSVKEQPIKAATRKHPYRPPNTSTPPSVPIPPPVKEPLDNIFIDALVQACHCRQHAPLLNSNTLLNRAGSLYHAARRKTIYSQGRQVRQLHGATSIHRPSLRRSPLSRDECLNMLDYYTGDYSTLAIWQEPEPTQSFTQSAMNLHPKTSGSLLDTNLDAELMALSSPVSGISGSHITDRPEVQRLLSTLQDPACTHEEAWQAYSALPSPGVAFLPKGSRQRLLQCLSIIERKNKESMFRYLSVIDDMNSIEQPLTKAEWNSAIAFAAHGYERINAAGVESALLKWKEMEQRANVRSGPVTFNILFDMATKAGKFVLAEMILKEMQNRQLAINRFARVGLIYFYGYKEDGDGVRQAYRDFVEAGEIVDTVVMNCVIASLIRAGELPAAEQVYERMKCVLRRHTGRRIPHLHWKEPRDLGRVLDRAARQYKHQPDKLQQVRDEQFLAPSQRTYAILVEHHATRTGELRRIGSLLAEMQELGIPMDGLIFVKVFKGFAYNGGIRYTAWTKARLESVRDSLFNVLDQKLDAVKLNRWLVVWAVRAFQKCCDHEQTLQMWENLRRRWKGEYSELATIHDILKDVLKEAVRHAAVAPTKMYI